jgi:hypothetical protein
LPVRAPGFAGGNARLTVQLAATAWAQVPIRCSARSFGAVFCTVDPHFMKKPRLFLASLPLWCTLALYTPAQAAPELSPSLKKALGGLPIAGVQDKLQGMVAALGKTPCGGGLSGCYMTQSGPLQLYLFSSQSAQQTVLLVVDQKMVMPSLLKGNVQQLFGGTGLTAPIISISTTDYTLDAARMPAPLQKVVRESYFNLPSLDFAAGVQMAARADLGGAMKLLFLREGIEISKLIMRAAVVMPITDLMGGGMAGAGVANEVAHGETMKNAGLDAIKPESYVEFQFPRGAEVRMVMPKLIMRDATFFLNNSLVFGYKGNATFEGVENKKVLMQFQTPLTPAGAMDLLDFSFRMATPPTLTLEDYAKVLVAMASPDPRLAKYGGGFVRNLEQIKKPLLTAVKPLAVFQVRNPVPQPDYELGNPNKPFPTDDKTFNVVLAGPAADGGPLMIAKGSVHILGQKMGWIDVVADAKGFDGTAVEDIALKLGPLGKVTVQKIVAQARINGKEQMIRLKGNYYGQVVEAILDTDVLTLNVPANCANPFEIKAKLGFTPTTNIADVFDAQGGVNVDPSKIGGCIGKELEAAYRKISNEYKHLAGYSAKEANEALKQMSGTAEYAAAQAQKQAEIAAAEAQKQAERAAAEAARQAEAARKTYESTKNAARDVATKSASAAANAFNEAGNAFKRIGKKKKHKKGPDPRFAASVFDWDYYYDADPSLAKAGWDLATHWKDHGFNQGRQGSPEFSVVFYRTRYLDVQALCGLSDANCALNHWLEVGLRQGRQGSADVSIASYMDRYQDVRSVFGQNNFEDAMEHWLNVGEAEGHNARPASAAKIQHQGMAQAGGGGGGPWDDSAVCQGQHVIGFRIRSGARVDGVQFLYPNGWGAAHGNLGRAPYTYEVVLPPGHYFYRAQYRSGSTVDALALIASSGVGHGMFGGQGGTLNTYTVNDGQRLGCMAGRAGAEIDQLTFSSTGPR